MQLSFAFSFSATIKISYSILHGVTTQLQPSVCGSLRLSPWLMSTKFGRSFLPARAVSEDDFLGQHAAMVVQGLAPFRKSFNTVLFDQFSWCGRMANLQQQWWFKHKQQCPCSHLYWSGCAVAIWGCRHRCFVGRRSCIGFRLLSSSPMENRICRIRGGGGEAMTPKTHTKASSSCKHEI